MALGFGLGLAALLAAADADLPERLVLDGVPRVGFYPRQSVGAPEDHPFCGCLRAILEFLDDPLRDEWLLDFGGDWHSVHEYLMGTSGHAFAAVWPKGGWSAGPNWDVTGFTGDPLEPVRRACAAIGYPAEILLRGDFARRIGADGPVSDDEAVYRARLVASLGEGRPAILFGPHHAPAPFLVCGYERGGEVLIGWSYFPDEPPGADPETYVRLADWFGGTVGLVTLGEPGARPERREVYRDALRHGLRLLRTREVRGLPAGSAAYEAWIGDLRDDASFAGIDDTTGRARLFASDDMGGHLAEARAWAGNFLTQAAAALPEAKAPLDRAEVACQQLHDLVWRLWQTGRGADAGHGVRFAEPAVRAELARIAGLMQTRDAELAAALEEALRLLGETVAPPADPADVARVAAHRTWADASGGDGDRLRFEQPVGLYLDGVPTLDYRETGTLPLPEALAAALAATRFAVDAVDLAGYGGWAFETPWPEPVDLAAKLEAAGLATGWRFRVADWPGDPDQVAQQRLVTELVERANVGLPTIIGYGGEPCVATGYHIWSINLLLRAWGRDEVVRVSADQGPLHGPVILIDGRREAIPAGEALTAAVALARSATGGPAALDAWRAALEAEPTDDLLRQHGRALQHTAAARRLAAEFLRRHGRPDAAAAYAAAAEAWARLLEASLDFIPELGGELRAADWTAADRAAAIDGLAEISGLEERAVGALARLPAP